MRVSVGMGTRRGIPLLWTGNFVHKRYGKKTVLPEEGNTAVIPLDIAMSPCDVMDVAQIKRDKQNTRLYVVSKMPYSGNNL